MNAFSVAGSTAFNALQARTTAALQAWGAGTETASEAVKKMMIGVVADMAQATGQFMMLDAFKTYPMINYPELAAGAGLIALSGALGALAGGGAKVGSGSAGVS